MIATSVVCGIDKTDKEWTFTPLIWRGSNDFLSLQHFIAPALDCKPKVRLHYFDLRAKLDLGQQNIFKNRIKLLVQKLFRAYFQK